MGMIPQFQAFITAFEKGKELSNAEVWKNRQVLGNKLFALISALIVIANGFGYVIEVDSALLLDATNGISALFALFNIILTVVTSSKVGRGAKK